MLDSLTAAAHIKQEAARSWGLHAALNERAPWDTEVFSVEQNRTAYQTITIRPRVFWNDPLHLRLGGERQREMAEGVPRSRLHFTDSFFWSDKHEVPPLQSDPLSHLCSFFHSHLPRLPSEAATPHPPRQLPSLLVHIFSEASFQSPLQSPSTPRQYLSGQLSRLCADSFLNKYHR